MTTPRPEPEIKMLLTPSVLSDAKAVSEPLTMTSIEIATLVRRPHATVLRVIKDLAAERTISAVEQTDARVPRDKATMEKVPLYRIGKNDSLVVVAHLSPNAAGRLMERWKQMEDAAAKPKAPAVDLVVGDSSGGAGMPATMSSREIAELTGKEHKNVLADIRKMLEELGKAAADFSAAAQVPGPNGSKRTIEIFELPKDLTITLVSGYSIPLRHRIVTRWQELEEKAATQLIPKSFSEALRLAAAQAEELDRKTAQLAISQPKAAALDLISAGEDALTITQAAKTLSVKRETLTAYMHAEGWIYRQNDSWVAYQTHIQNGRLLYKEAHYTDQTTGKVCTSPYCHILPKGLALLARHFAAKKEA